MTGDLLALHRPVQPDTVVQLQPIHRIAHLSIKRPGADHVSGDVRVLARCDRHGFEEHARRLAVRHRLCSDDLLRVQQQAFNQGFGERTEGSWEYAVRLPFLIRAVALPVRSQGRVVGSMALQWPRDEHSVSSVRRRYLDNLAETISRLQHRLD